MAELTEATPLQGGQETEMESAKWTNFSLFFTKEMEPVDLTF